MPNSPPKLEACFFRTTSGREPVREWLMSLPKDERKTIGTDIAYIQYKWPIGRPHAGHLRGDIWETRSKLRTRIARVLFAIDGKEMVLLHGFIKTSQRTPHEDLALAESRWREWQRE